MKHTVLITAFLITACSSYRTPTVSQDPAKMSADTLCFRYGSSNNNEALAEEITARGINCARILESDPLYTSGRY